MTEEQIEGTRLIAEYTKEYTSLIAPNGKVMLIDGAGYCGYLESFRTKYHESLDAIKAVVDSVFDELYSMEDDKQAEDLATELGEAAIELDIDKLFPAIVSAIRFLNSNQPTNEQQ